MYDEAGSVLDATRLSLGLIGVALLVLFVVGAVQLGLSARRWRNRWLTSSWRAAMPQRERPHGRAGLGARSATASNLSVAASSTWWFAQRDRQRMWRAVVRAEQAVHAAARKQMAIGELQQLVRELRLAADSVDAGLAPGVVTGGPGRDLREQAQQIVRAADDITQAVGGTLAGESRPRIDRVVAAIATEVEAVRHGRQVSGR